MSASEHQVTGSPAFEAFARAGIAARAFVYAVVGVLALKLALGEGGKATSQQGALKTIAQGGFGKALLVLVAFGLGAYALWRLTRAALGHGVRQRDDAKDRIAAVSSGVVYAGLCVTAIQILAGSGGGSSSGGSGSPKGATGGVLSWTLGPLLVAVAGAVMVGIAVYQVKRALTTEFLEDSHTERMSDGVQHVFTVLAVAGHLARGVVFGLIGYGVAKAAIDYDPDAAIGLDGALRQLQDASYGPWLLGLVAAGLICFAAYAAFDARYRKV